MKRKLLGLVILALFLLLPLAVQAATAGKFTSLEGNVDVTSPGKEAKPAKPGDSLNAGDIVRTKSKAKCEVSFPDGSILRLAENTRLRISEFAMKKGQRQTTLDLFRGKVQNVVQAVTGDTGKQSKYEIRTPMAVCGVRGTILFVYHQAGVTGAAFKEGTGYGYSLNRPRDVRTIQAGQVMIASNPNVPPVIRLFSASEMNQLQKDTTPSGKPPSGVKKDGEKQAESPAAQTGAGKPQQESQTEKSRPADIVAQTMGTPSTAALSLLPGATAPSPSALSAPTVVPMVTATLTSGSSGAGAVIVVPITDATPPKITRLTPDNFSDATKITNQSSAIFTVEFNETATISYSLDGKNYFSAEGNKLVLSGLPEGSHTVYVKGIDLSGNISSATTYAWTTDYTAPTITLSGMPAAITNAQTAAIGIAASEQVTYTYTLNGAAITSPNLTNLPEGSNKFTVTATDAVGNTSTQTYTWTTDYTPPGITINPQASPVADGKTDIKIALTGTEAADFATTLDGNPVLAGEKITFTGLAAGSHTLAVQAKDKAGNIATQSLSFDLSRYALTGNFYGCLGNVYNTAPVTGQVAGVSGYNWGGWNLEMKGSGNATPNASWTLSAGGGDAKDGYWMSIAPGTTDFSAKTLSGTSQLNYLSPTRLGYGAGNVTGTYDGLGKYQLSDIGVGSYTEKPVRFLSSVSAGLDGSGLNGLLGGSDSLWSANWQTPAGAIFLGTYDGERPPPGQTWQTDIASNNPQNGSYTTHDGGAYRGYLAGIDLPPTADPGPRSLEALAAALYIDPAGNAGYVTGSLSGPAYPEIGMFLMKGELVPNGMSGVGVTAAKLYDSVWSWSSRDSDNSPNWMSTMSIVNYDTNAVSPWGIYQLSLAGTLDNQASGNIWSGRVGGGGVFGASRAYRDTEGGINYPAESGYSYSYDFTNDKTGSSHYLAPGREIWTSYHANGTTSITVRTNDSYANTKGVWDTKKPLADLLSAPPADAQRPADLTATAWVKDPVSQGVDDNGIWLASVGKGTRNGNRIGGTLSGRFLTPTKLGLIGGDLVGTYNTADGAWQGVSAGGWSGTPIAFLGSNIGGLYANASGRMKLAGLEFSVLGITDSPWDGTKNALTMGQLVKPSETASASYLWNDLNFLRIISMDTDQQFRAFKNGIWRNGAVEGYTAGIYLTANGTAGVIQGPLTGNYYDELGMWEADGSLTKTQMTAAANSYQGTGVSVAGVDFGTNLGILRLSGAFSNGTSAQGAINGQGTMLTSFLYLSLLKANPDDSAQTIELPPLPLRWGTFDMTFNGNNIFGSEGATGNTYSGRTSPGWSAKMGGIGPFTLVQAPFYYLGSITDGTWDAEGNIRGTLAGTYQTLERRGTFTGPFFGLGTDGTTAGSGDWIGSSVGTYTANAKLNSFGGLWGNAAINSDSEVSGLYSDDGERVTMPGAEIGLIAGLAKPWTASAAFQVMGMYDYQDKLSGAKPHYLLYTPVSGYDRPADATASDPVTSGYFQGYSAGIWRQTLEQSPDLDSAPVPVAGSLSGSLRALAVAPETVANGVRSRTLGMLTSDDVSGTLYPGLGMWTAQGNLKPDPKLTLTVTDTAEAPVSISIDSSYGSRATLLGKFSTEGATNEIYGRGTLTTQFFTISGQDGSSSSPHWGLYSLMLPGPDKTLGFFTGQPATGDSWSAFVSGRGQFGYEGDGYTAEGYWLATVKGKWTTTGEITGTLGAIAGDGATFGRYLTPTSLGTIGGAFYGLNAAQEGAGAWQAMSLGAWNGTALSHASETYPNLTATSWYYTGRYSYDDGGSYRYYYYTDNHRGYVSYRRPDASVTSYDITYYADGTYRKTEYGYGDPDKTGTNDYYMTGRETGTWTPREGLSFIANAVDATKATLVINKNHGDQYVDGYLDALLGGTDTIWTATRTTPAKITMMGYYDSSASAPHLWGNFYYYAGNIRSRNYKDGSNTTYDGGAYQGFLAGTEIFKAMDARLVALYLDPSGNAGYLKGTLTGRAYPEIRMFVMDGSLYPTHLAAKTGIAPADLAGSIYSHTTPDPTVAGTFATGGKIKSDNKHFYYDYNGLRTMSLVNYEANKAEPWGIYSLGLAGIYTAPAAASTSWTAQTGGKGSFGVYNAANRYSGTYSYGDGGSYEYNYYTDNRSGAVSYRRPEATITSYDITYHADGTYTKIEYAYGDSQKTGASDYYQTGKITGSWTLKDGLAFIKTAADATQAVLDSEDKHGVGRVDKGYWLADITSGQAEGNKLTGNLGGRFITRTKLGTIGGDLLGTYNSSDDTWQATSLGAWSGTDLSHVSKVSSQLTTLTRAYEGEYSYSDGGSYSYIYTTAQHIEGHASYRRPEATITSYDITYHADGTYTKIEYGYGDPQKTGTNDYYETGTKTGTWTLQEGLAFIATAADADQATLLASNSDVWQEREGKLKGLLGGTDTIWTATQATPAKITLMGTYKAADEAPHLWGNTHHESGNIGSRNFEDRSKTTYDGGAYRGYLAGTEIDKAMEARLVALYVDPSGNAGYLKGALAGNAYPEIGMFAMDGSLYPTQLAAKIGIAPADLTKAIYLDDASYIDPEVAGAFATGGKIKSDNEHFYYGYNGLQTLSLVNHEANKAEPWGIYSLGMAGNYAAPATASTSWTAKAGGEGSFGAYNRANRFRPDRGYWLADITSGQAEGNKLTGNLGGRFITSTKLGTMGGDLLGTYNGPDGTWQAISLGAWSGTALSHVSNVSSPLLDQTKLSMGSYSYADDGVYQYAYFARPIIALQSLQGLVSYRRPDASITSYEITYYSDGTYRKTEYGYVDPNKTGTNDYYVTGRKTGIWTPQDGLSFVATAADATQATLISSYNYIFQYPDGWIEALLGGTDAIWTATQNIPAKITMMGIYDSSSTAPHIWGLSGTGVGALLALAPSLSPMRHDSFGNIMSQNYQDRSFTTYDGGAYEGYLAGTVIDKAMDARLMALYIDPSGNAGYLKGALTGQAYPEIGMFAMDGSLYPTQMAAKAGIAPADLTSSVYSFPSFSQSVSGAFATGGKIKSQDGEIIELLYPTNVMLPLSLVNYEANKAEPWGIYSLSLAGTYETPATASTLWTAKVGGPGRFGAYNAANYHYGTYSYGDGGSYDYNYYTDNRAGDVNYRRPEATITSYDISYHADGTYTKTEYGYGDPNKTGANNYYETGRIAGTWTPQDGLSFVAKAADASQATLDSEDKYGVAAGDRGYWLADITSGKAEGSKLTGAVSGRFITRTKFGTIGGDLLGTYNPTDNTWQAFSLGTWVGKDLQFVSNVRLSELGWDANWIATGMDALMGGTNSIFANATADTTMIGRYSGHSGLWAQEEGRTVISNNFKNDTASTYDGRSYRGYLSLAVDDTKNAGAQLIALLYDAPDFGGTPVGYLKGTLSGTAYPDQGLFAIDGSLQRIDMTGDPSSWGIWQTWLNNINVGTSGAPSASFSWDEAMASTDKTWWENYYSVPDLSAATAITTWTGSVAAARADWVSAATGVIGGEIKGLYNPATASWKAIAQGAFIETAKFLQMQGGATTTETANAALKGLNIPAVQVGKATLSQGSGTVNNLTGVTMTDVTFFANSTGGAPRIWATDKVSGSYSTTAAPSLTGPAVPLSSGPGGLTADFGIRNWNAANGTWGANITNGTGNLSGGSYTGPIQFKGGAAGTFGNGALTTGTAAGIATPLPAAK